MTLAKSSSAELTRSAKVLARSSALVGSARVARSAVLVESLRLAESSKVARSAELAGSAVVYPHLLKLTYQLWWRWFDDQAHEHLALRQVI